MASRRTYRQGTIQLILALAVLYEGGRTIRAQENTDDLRKLIEVQNKRLEEQQKQLEEMKQRLDSLSNGQNVQPVAAQVGGQLPESGLDEGAPKSLEPRSGEEEAPSPTPLPDRTALEKIIDNFLKERPGVGMPNGVQTGFEAGQGFYIRSAPNPTYSNWQDQSRIPFELRIRGRVQLNYNFYKPTDNLNHLTGQRYEPEVGDFSQLEVKRLRLFWEGTAFDPNLRYQFQLDGNTRGLAAIQNNRIIQTTGTPPGASFAAPGIGGAASPIGGGATVDAGVRIFTAWVAYDFQLGARGKGCGPDCPDGTYTYHPVLTFIVGKQQPFFGFTEILGSANAQFVDFAMADWFFDADDNNMLTAAAVQYRDFDDRLFATAMITNGNDSQFPNTQMDRLPGFIAGFWYDLGGIWDAQGQRYQLWGTSPSDLEWSPNPVMRVGGAVDLVPMDRRSIYGDDEQSRVLVSPGAPNGTRIINLLDGAASTPAGAHAVDKFDYYAFDAWASFHWRGFSLTNEWWYRRLTGFQTVPAGGNLLIYQDGSGANALFPGGNLTDFGTLVQGGYFVIPKKLELVARYDMIEGDSGDINGTGKFRTVVLPGVTGPVRVIDGAFRNFHQVTEIAAGFNYFFYGQLVKWSTNMAWYRGGNPAIGGQSPVGFVPGVDGWLVETQLQLAF
ncbi:MAG TPA: hypothetical protein VH575_32070 [Gemmataceae bacterium]